MALPVRTNIQPWILRTSEGRDPLIRISPALFKKWVHGVVVVAHESRGDTKVGLGAAVVVGVPMADEVPTVNPAVDTVAVEVLINVDPLPISPVGSSFNTHTSASPAPKYAVSPATTYLPSTVCRIATAELLSFPP